MESILEELKKMQFEFEADVMPQFESNERPEGCQYVPQYPNKRAGLCKLSNVYGPHGCDCKRTGFCQTGLDVEPCDCTRCHNECSEDCPSFSEQAGGECRHSNSYGQHGCPECAD